MKWYYWVIIAVILFFAFKKPVVIMKTMKEIFMPFIMNEEGFRSAPYWDRKQWSWGYGTRVPGSINSQVQRPGGTITKAKAAADAFAHAVKDYDYLDRLIKVDLNSNQWAALLSFSYNFGADDADNLVKNINAKNSEALRKQWLLYENKKRREKELSLFFTG